MTSTPQLSRALPEIEGIGRSIFDPVWAEKEHANPTAELVHVIQGSVKVRAADYAIVARACDTIYTPSGMPHRDVFPPETVYEVILVHFRWSGEPAMLKAYTPVQLAKASAPDKREIAADVHALYQEFLRPLPYARELTGARLLQIIYRLCRRAAGAAGGGDDTRSLARARRVQIMDLTRAAIDRMFDQPITLDTLAEAVGVSPYYLSRVFSQESGFTLSAYLTTVRMEHAGKLLMEEPRMNIAEVAHAVGFRDSHYFGKVFKTHFKLTPSAYRSRHILKP